MCACREDREDFDLKAAEGSTGKRGRPEGAGVGGGGGGGGGGGKRVFANNLAEETTWQALKDYFKQAGPVAHADVLAVCPTYSHDLESKPKKIFWQVLRVYMRKAKAVAGAQVLAVCMTGVLSHGTYAMCTCDNAELSLVTTIICR